jgi:hypothetical protein
MKFSIAVVTAVFLASSASVDAFSQQSAIRRPATFLASTPTDPDGGEERIAKLRASAAKARADADRLNEVRYDISSLPHLHGEFKCKLFAHFLFFPTFRIIRNSAN